MNSIQLRSAVSSKLVEIYMDSREGSDKRAAALRALGRLGGEDAFNLMVTVLGERATPALHEAAIEAIGEIGRAAS